MPAIAPHSDFFKIKSIHTLLIKTCHNIFKTHAPIHTVHRIIECIPEEETLIAHLHQVEGLARVRATAVKRLDIAI
ncbi:hypothetical protein FGSG_11679 [Fusarium graminearum PH-1]|uniref:hypothetical protein n=1 Tax=Gibberella zeae (strain ATCC MYA-4620 / CBS 123657 / FGSC 9075 / NRRL 31084 / PH-1) TaxID=229533 RepID=UPI00021F1B42|nr:hypothetical protein FGSG_11679 [Fusarium graminearum PH-1]ESU05230.1 hypothetical protein FGSG_11679 [Fusarium graminearum PH-1]|eukprot:XP_011315715.1 hypothetical protein FGSG_11679 [Fusarium graminearum PH-1]